MPKPETVSATSAKLIEFMQSLDDAELEVMAGLIASGAPEVEAFDIGDQVDAGALCFLVLMSATKGSQDDLKAIMDGVKMINTAKENLRNHWP